MNREQVALDVTVEQVEKSFQRNNGSVRATATELGISRSSVRRKLANTGMLKKPLAGGSITGVKTRTISKPKKGEIKRFILTSAQNNTYVHAAVWDNILALAKYYDATILVGTYTYNQNHYGQLSVKRGKDKSPEKELWYDPAVEPYINDQRIELGKGLVWCGEYNALPTAVNPLAGLESYSGRKSAIFPHAKLAMRSIPTMQGEGTKLNYTTGTITQRNYIQKREGVVAEFHHIYGALLVEVDSNGHWWVRQLNQDEGTGTMQDLRILVQGGKIVSKSATVEAITYGDLHGTFADPDVVETSLEMRDTLTPKYQFLHDVMEGAAVNPHARKYGNNHDRYWTWLRGYNKLETELAETALLLSRFDREDTETVIVDSNHDDVWLKRWLQEYDYRKDPSNAEIFLDLQRFVYANLRASKAEELMPRDINVLQYALNRWGGYGRPAKFLVADESFLICDRKIECGMHGHLGPNGRFATPENLSKMARKANTAHTHSAGIYNGLYVAGTSSKFRWDYTKGPSSWSHSHIVTYPNGKRTIVTLYEGKWKA